MTAQAGKLVWSIALPGSAIVCSVTGGCGTVDLSVEQGGESLAREVHPDFSTAYERARALRVTFDETACGMEQQPYLRTPTCVVRPWRASDAPDLAQHANNEKIGLNLRDGFPYPFTDDEAVRFIGRARALEPLCRFAITVDGAAVGSVGFTLHPNVERVSAEIGYWLGEAFWGRGITADAVRAVTRYAIENHGLTRVFAVPYAWNPPSFRVLEKAGFVCEGRMRRSVIKRGEVLDQLLYAFVVEEAGNPDAVLSAPGSPVR